MYFAFSAALAPTGNWQVAILSFSFVSGGVAGRSGASPAFASLLAPARDDNALRLATPARALPVAWTASRLVIFSAEDIRTSFLVKRPNRL
jgi:hypothetical protein